MDDWLTGTAVATKNPRPRLGGGTGGSDSRA